jgi:hypothetical protein
MCCVSADTLLWWLSGLARLRRMTHDRRQDETILPTDHDTAGEIVDDELNELLVAPLQPGVMLHCLIDACHSGTAMDLPYRIKADLSGRMAWKVWRAGRVCGLCVVVCGLCLCVVWWSEGGGGSSRAVRWTRCSR